MSDVSHTHVVPISYNTSGVGYVTGTVLTGSLADFGKLIADETEKWAR
jgi:hypothetical protein